MNHTPLDLPITNEFEEKVQSILYQHEWLLSDIVEEIQVTNPKFNPLGIHIMKMGLTWKESGNLLNALTRSAEKASTIEELHELVKIWLDDNLPDWETSFINIKDLVAYAKKHDEQAVAHLNETKPGWQDKTLEQVVEEGKLE